MIARAFRLLFRLICYLALVLVVSGVGSLILVSKLDVCPTLNESQIQCITPFYESLGNYGMGVTLITVFTGLPGILAIVGLIFLGYDLGDLLRKPDSPK